MLFVVGHEPDAYDHTASTPSAFGGFAGSAVLSAYTVKFVVVHVPAEYPINPEVTAVESARVSGCGCNGSLVAAVLHGEYVCVADQRAVSRAIWTMVFLAAKITPSWTTPPIITRRIGTTRANSTSDWPERRVAARRSVDELTQTPRVRMARSNGPRTADRTTTILTIHIADEDPVTHCNTARLST